MDLKEIDLLGMLRQIREEQGLKSRSSIHLLTYFHSLLIRK